MRIINAIMLILLSISLSQLLIFPKTTSIYKKGFEEGRIFERELLLNTDSSKVNCLFGYIPDSLYKMNLPELKDSGSYKIRGK